ncbi:DNA polymerase III, alpha subunit [Lactiplantibacillus pentosus KCA1]|nr:3'-5' exonuclease [Lactiplantibacillus pentosus]EIW14330.1 DNA polymerase III, alpha subunit [Lactiplantibacillus pentosus KCA1]
MKKVTGFLVIIFAIVISIQYWWALLCVSGISLTIFGIIRARKDKQRKSRQSIYQVDKHGQQSSIGKDISLHGRSDESQDIGIEDAKLKNVRPHESHRDKLDNGVTSDKSVNSNLNKPTLIEKDRLPASTRPAPHIHKLRRKLTNFVVFDIETTGFNRFEETIIQISALKFKKDQLIDDFNCYVNPHRKLQQKISSLTGLTDEKLKNAPDLNYALDKFTHFVADFPLVGHNIMGFDLPFLIEKGFYLPDIEALDTLPLSRRKLPELKGRIYN